MRKIFLAAPLALIVIWYFIDTPVSDQDQETRANRREVSQSSPITKESSSSLPSPANKNRLVVILEEILKSKDDNDPRLDTEFRNLSHKDKSDLIVMYHSLPAEDRNGRGTIVFLIGRSLSQPADFDFLTDVISEAPCLSLENCQQAISNKDPHADIGVNTTLYYPQLVAITSVEKFIKNSPRDLTKSLLNSLESFLRTAKSTDYDMIRKKAENIDHFVSD